MRAGGTDPNPQTTNDRRLTLLGYGAYALLGWTGVLLPSLIVPIQDSFGTNDADFGLVYFIVALCYGIGGLGAGFLTERIGPRIVLMVAFLVISVTLFGASVLTVWVLFVATVSLGRAATGAIDAGFGALFLSVFANRRGSALSLLHLCYAVASFATPALMGLALAAGVNWRILFGIGAVAGILGVLGLTRLDWSIIAPPDRNRATSVEADRGRLMTPAFIAIAATMVMFNAQISGIVAWIVRYMDEEGARFATFALSAFWLGVMVSRFLARWLLTLLPAHRLGIVLLSGTTISLIAVMVAPEPWLAFGLLTVAGFFAGPIYPLLIGIAGDMFPDRLGRVSGGMTAAATIGALTYPPLIGWIATEYSIRTGLLIAAVLGVPAVAALMIAYRLRPSD